MPTKKRRKKRSLMRMLAVHLTVSNKGKRRVPIGQVREDLAKLSVKLVREPKFLAALLNNGQRIVNRQRAARRCRR